MEDVPVSKNDDTNNNFHVCVRCRPLLDLEKSETANTTEYVSVSFPFLACMLKYCSN